jgi:hypothetical protein
MRYAVLEQRHGQFITHRGWAELERDEVTVGRSGEIIVGARSCRHRTGRDPLRCEKGDRCTSPDHDFGVSANVLTLRRTGRGWSLEGGHVNGMQIIPWCGDRVPAPTGDAVAAMIENDRRVAVHLSSASAGRDHFLMLHTDGSDPGVTTYHRSGLTQEKSAALRDHLLPSKDEKDAIYKYFEEFMAWPPRLDAKLPNSEVLISREKSRLQGYMGRCRKFCAENDLTDPYGLSRSELLKKDRDEYNEKGAYSVEFVAWLAQSRLLSFDPGDDVLPR